MSSAFAMPDLAGALINSPERQLFASRDLAQTRSLVGAVMKPHDLHVHGPSQQVNARMHHMAFGGVSLNRLKYGADVDIEPGPLDNFYLIQMPLSGHALITSGDQQIGADPDLAAVISPSDSTVMRWSADCDQLMVRIDRMLVDRAIGALSGRLDPETVRFQLGFRWRECAPWRCLVHYLNECAGHPFDASQYRLMVAHIEQLVVATLLSAQPHDMRESKPHCAAVLPRHVKRVQDYLRANAAEPVTADQMAMVQGSACAVYTLASRSIAASVRCSTCACCVWTARARPCSMHRTAISPALPCTGALATWAASAWNTKSVSARAQARAYAAADGSLASDHAIPDDHASQCVTDVFPAGFGQPVQDLDSCFQINAQYFISMPMKALFERF